MGGHVGAAISRPKRGGYLQRRSGGCYPPLHPSLSKQQKGSIIRGSPFQPRRVCCPQAAKELKSFFPMTCASGKILLSLLVCPEGARSRLLIPHKKEPGETWAPFWLISNSRNRSSSSRSRRSRRSGVPGCGACRSPGPGPCSRAPWPAPWHGPSASRRCPCRARPRW